MESREEIQKFLMDSYVSISSSFDMLLSFGKQVIAASLGILGLEILGFYALRRMDQASRKK